MILLYHALGSSPFALPCSVFRAQMEWLASTAEVVPLAELLEDRGATPLQVAITFDDGYASLHAAVLPILIDIGTRPTVFLNTGWIAAGDRRRSDVSRGHYPQEEFLRWNEVEDLAAAGWSIGSHGVDHLDLTTQPDEIVRMQLSVSRAHIENAVGVCSAVFSYTWGRHTPRLRQLVAEAGYTHAVAGLHGALTDKTDPLAIPRVDIVRNYTIPDFKAVVRGDWDYLAWVQRARASGIAI